MYRILGVVVVLSLGLLACSTLQTGILPGKWLRDDQPRVVITMGWQSHTSTHETGDLRVTFPSGERYFGSFVRLIDGVKLTNRMSVYDAWSMANVWPAGAGLGYYGVPGEWGGWGVGAFPDFASFERDYSGKVVGGLSSAKGNAIRCKFRVNDPQVGFISGGSGACQVSLGGHILLHF